MLHTAAISRDVDALGAAARRAGMTARVPSCPDWDVHQLVVHLGSTHRWAATQVRARSDTVAPLELGELPEGLDATLDWFLTGAADLVALLDATDPDEAVWTWAGDHRAGFWARRMAHETAVHAWDGSAAASRLTPIDGELAVDGIDEQLENLPAVFAFRPELQAALRGSGETMHLHATDREGEWLITRTSDGIEWSHGHAKGDVAARASASDLWLFLVGRVAPDQLEVFGDEALLERWQRDFSC